MLTYKFWEQKYYKDNKEKLDYYKNVYKGSALTLQRTIIMVVDFIVNFVHEQQWTTEFMSIQKMKMCLNLSISML